MITPTEASAEPLITGLVLVDQGLYCVTVLLLASMATLRSPRPYAHHLIHLCIDVAVADEVPVDVDRALTGRYAIGPAAATVTW